MDDPIKALDAIMEKLDAKLAEDRDSRPPQPTDPIAPAGKVWICCACGKRTKDRYGDERGWDESCMLNSVLTDE
jgi:hypothetical protein